MTAVCPSSSKEGYLAENTLRLALKRLGFPVTVHGFRPLLTDVMKMPIIWRCAPPPYLLTKGSRAQASGGFVT